MPIRSAQTARPVTAYGLVQTPINDMRLPVVRKSHKPNHTRNFRWSAHIGSSGAYPLVSKQDERNSAYASPVAPRFEKTWFNEGRGVPQLNDSSPAVTG